MEPAVEVSGLKKTYPGGIKALDGIDLSVASGTIFGLLGPNGAGKSTTIKILTTLALPDEGKARVAGIDVLDHPDRVRRVIGVVGQRSGVDPTATGAENLTLQGRLFGLGGHSLGRRVSDLLDQFGLTEAAGRQVRTYSGGMQRRLDIALAMVHRPQVLFLDEPTTGLDPEVRAAMWQEITRLSAQEGLTILLTTHYLEEADRLAHRLAIVDRGRMVATGTPHELKAQLQGDAIHLELIELVPGERVQRALQRASGIGEVMIEERSIRARAVAGATALPLVLSALESEGISVASATVAGPSLDDVYLRHTGRVYAQADK